MTNEAYRQTPESLLYQYGTGSDGLNEEQVCENREKYGENAISEGKKESPLIIFLSQFKDFLVIILIIAALISTLTGDKESFIVIIAVITMNAILGTVQTLRAEKSLDNLKKLSSPHAKVLRGGVISEIDSAELVVGDIVLLEAGDRIAADGRLIEAASVQTNESALTGESMNINKDAEVIPFEVPLADRKNMVYSGSFVTGGRGRYLVTAVGMDTEVGKIAALIQSAQERKTPLQRSLDNFGKKLSVCILIICAVVFGLSLFNVIRQGGEINFASVMDSFMFAVALAVAAIPEALSSIVTIVLSLGTQKMSAENAVMRKLQAVEGLGSVSVICSDKTGTLTQNKMTVRKVVIGSTLVNASSLKSDDPRFTLLRDAAVLCNDGECGGEKEIGDPTETALVRFAADTGADWKKIRKDNRRISEVPFDSDRKLMSVLVEANGKKLMFTKGAADVMVGRMCISAQERHDILEKTERLSAQGLRVLCFGYKETAQSKITECDENGLNYLGLLAMMDPPRPESKDAVAECRSAGIKPVMITGDHIVTAAAIAKEIGILQNDSEAVEGKALDSLTDEQLTDYVADKSVYARVTPEHKIRIVKAWQRRNCIVAMTGDGVNDAPALKQADVGVAMGITGTEVSKDAAAMVLTDDNFATIVKAVKNGRNLYVNIKKSILFLLSGNMAGIIAVLFCSIFALPVPFEPIHLLFINLLTDSLPAIALGLEPHTDDVMKQPPRPANETILTGKFLGQITWSGIVIAAATLAAFIFGLKTSVENAAGAASTMAFATLCLSRLFHGFSCKSEAPVLFSKKMFSNKWGILAFLAGFALLSAVLFIPALHGLFKIAELTAAQNIAIYALSLGSMLVIQMIKGFIHPKE